MKNIEVLHFYQKIYLKLLEKKKNWKEEQRFPGGLRYPDKQFYIIRRSGMRLGLFSFFNTNLARIDYAIQNGMIPVVDMQNFRNSYQEEGEYALVNSWEKYFEQPTEYSLKDAYSARKIVLSDSGAPKEAPNDSMDFFTDVKDNMTYWRKQCKKYIRIQPSVKELFEKEYSRLFQQQDKVLGVLARGTDYVKLRPSQHPVQPTVEQLLEKTKEVMQEYGCNKVFLATEDSDIAKVFFKEFGDQCVTNSQEYVEYKEGYLSEIKSEKKDDIYTRGLNYLITILLLAKCNCIVAGRTSGTVGAALLSDGWEYSYFFDLGYYE